MHIIKQQWNRNSVGNSSNYTVTHGDNKCAQVNWQRKLLRVNPWSPSDITGTDRRSLLPLFCRIQVRFWKVTMSSSSPKIPFCWLRKKLTPFQITVNKNCVSKFYKYLLLFRYKNIHPARIKILPLLSLASAEWALCIYSTSIPPDLSQLVDGKWGCFTSSVEFWQNCLLWDETACRLSPVCLNGMAVHDVTTQLPKKESRRIWGRSTCAGGCTVSHSSHVASSAAFFAFTALKLFSSQSEKDVVA